MCVCVCARAAAVQHECIPQAILGMDVLCQAKSGMGKTAGAYTCGLALLYLPRLKGLSGCPVA